MDCMVQVLADFLCHRKCCRGCCMALVRAKAEALVGFLDLHRHNKACSYPALARAVALVIFLSSDRRCNMICKRQILAAVVWVAGVWAGFLTETFLAVEFGLLYNLETFRN